MRKSGFSSKGQFEFQNLVNAAYLAKKILLLELDGDQTQAREQVEPGISIKGVRMWLLLASCLIASIGLNTNSTAVVIGAMLISPLMGPILGLGFGMATTSNRMIRSSLRNLLFAVFISLAIATLYFIVSPFQDPTSEILSRTAPNLLDLLVAIAAAFAGVVAMNSSSLAGAVPGVAIATAIMPPLCACAFGIAHGDWKIALGAFYLFFVNAVAIAVVAYLLFKRMHFSQDTRESSEKGKIKPAMISLAILLVVIPLAWSLWDAWRDNFVLRSVSRLVQNYKPQLEVVSWQWDALKGKKLVLYNFRKSTPEIRAELENELKKISPKATLELHESAVAPGMEELANQIKTSQLSELVNNPKLVEGLVRLASSDGQTASLMDKLLSAEAELVSLTGAQNQVRAYLRTELGAAEAYIVITTKNRGERNRIRKELPRYEDWLNTKLQNDAKIKVEVL